MKNLTGFCLITKDGIRLSTFYRDLLGVDMQGAGHGSFTIEFQVENVDLEFERLIKMDAHIVKPPTTYPWGRRAVWFRDPDGNIVNFYQVMM